MAEEKNDEQRTSRAKGLVEALGGGYIASRNLGWITDPAARYRKIYQTIKGYPGMSEATKKMVARRSLKAGRMVNAAILPFSAAAMYDGLKTYGVLDEGKKAE